MRPVPPGELREQFLGCSYRWTIGTNLTLACDQFGKQEKDLDLFFSVEIFFFKLSLSPGGVLCQTESFSITTRQCSLGSQVAVCREGGAGVCVSRNVLCLVLPTLISYRSD